MKLYTICTSCRQSIKIRSGAATRHDLQMEKGDEFVVECQHCLKKTKVHANDVRAELNKTILLTGLIIGVLVTVILWRFYGAIGTVSGVIPVVFWQQQMMSIKSFNSFTIRRK